MPLGSHWTGLAGGTVRSRFPLIRLRDCYNRIAGHACDLI